MKRLEGVKVLVIDDMEDMLFMVVAILRTTSAKVDTAATSEAGLAKARGGGYDVILMDMQMPDMPGLMAVEQLRREGYTGVVLGHSARAFSEDRAEAMRRGCDGYITKPSGVHGLISGIESALIARRLRVVQSPVPEGSWPPSNSAPPAKA